jgi:CTP synthase (UTP-ammonia lyase)
MVREIFDELPNPVMRGVARIGLIGDYDLQVRAHVAIPLALALASNGEAASIKPVWLPTLDLQRNIESRLENFRGFWCVPASPYASMNGALNAIRFARERKIPFLGTCGGFQHALIEFARNVLGIVDADHGESNPSAANPLITHLACPLREIEGRIVLKAGTRARSIYGRDEITEPFNCSFGLKPRQERLFNGGSLHITGTDENGSARIVELADHPFFIATLFQPERSAFKQQRHPLIAAFVEAVLKS